MAKRVVLAYSGGLDTSVAVRWLQEELDVEVSPWRSTSARVATSRWCASGPSAPGRSKPWSSTPGPRWPRLRRAGHPGQRPLRGQVPARLGAVAPGHRAPPGGRGPPPRGRRGRPRLHGQRQRPGPLRGRAPAPWRPTSRSWRPARMWGMTREDCVAYAARHGHPHRGHQGEALLDRREPLGPGHRVRRDRGSLGRTARRRLRPDRADRHRAASRSSSASRRACPVTSTAGRLALAELIAEVGAVVGSYGWGRHRHGREPPGRDQEPGDLRVPGRAGAAAWPTRISEDLTLERDVAHEKARLEPRWAELVYDGLWFSPLKEALDAFFASTQRHVTGEVRLRCRPGSCMRHGPAQPGVALRPRPRHLRRQRTPSTTPTPKVRPAVGSGRGHVGGPPGGPAPRGTAARDPVGGTAGRDGRGGHGLHREPALRPAAGRRRPDRLAGPCPRAWRAGVLDDGEVGDLLAALDRVEEELELGDLRLPARATRTSTPPSSAG